MRVARDAQVDLRRRAHEPLERRDRRGEVARVPCENEADDEEGVEGFANGIKERALYWTPAIGIFLACYCSLRQLALGVLDL